MEVGRSGVADTPRQADDFLDQLALPDTDLTRAMFTWNTNVFLFEASVGSRDTFKVVEQQSDLQTAEEHYATEE